MILAALSDYYQRLQNDPYSGISPPGYSLEKISYAIVIDTAGNVADVEDIRDYSGKKPVPKGLIVPASFKRPGTGSNPFFLWDKTTYALGVGSQVDRNEKNYVSFKDRHKSELAESGDDGLNALLKFLDKWHPDELTTNAKLKVHAESMVDTSIVFRLDGDLCYLHERPKAKALYSKLTNSSDQGGEGVCLVTGEVAYLVRIHPSIKGILGTKNAETSIVSFNDEAYLSYKGALDKLRSKNRENNSSSNAPISKKVAESYVAALNFLLRSKRQRISVGDTNVVFWAQTYNSDAAQAAEDLFLEFLDPKDEEMQKIGRLRDVLEMIRQGQPLSSLSEQLNGDTKIFILGLAPNASRLSIRFWETDTLESFAERLAAHFYDLQLEPSPWRTPPALWKLLLSTAPNRDGKAKSEDVPPQLAGELARAILTGQRYPYNLLSILIMRMRADGDERAFGPRAALIKAILERARRLGQKASDKGEIPVSLDTNNTNPGYLLGRLFAVLENVQRKALGEEINSTIRDRFYGAASATPASVFPMLVRNAQNHLGRLRKGKPGIAVNLEKEIAEILDSLGVSFPKSMGLEAQGRFAIGYYHQSKTRYTAKNVQSENGDTNEKGDSE